MVVGAVATYGYTEYVDAAEELAEKGSIRVGLCHKIQSEITATGNSYKGKSTFKITPKGQSQEYSVHIVHKDNSCWIVASHSESHFSFFYGWYQEPIEDVLLGDCPAYSRSGCECTKDDIIE